MHNLKHRAILGTLWRLARKRAQCEPSESENKTNDGNGRNYIYGRVLIWLAKSLPFPSLSPAYLLLAHFERQPLDLPLPPFSIYHSVKFSRLVFFTICSSAQAAEERSCPLTFPATATKNTKCATSISCHSPSCGSFSDGPFWAKLGSVV